MASLPRSVRTIASAALTLPARRSATVCASSAILVARVPPELVEPLLLPGIVGGQPTQTFELARERGPRALIRLDIAVIVGQQEAALAGLRVAHRQIHRLQLLYHMETMQDEIRRPGAGSAAPASRKEL